MKTILTTILSGVTLFAACLALAACSSKDFSYETPSRPQVVDARHIRVAANDNYQKVGSVKKFMFGDHFRKEWATPVTVEVMNLDSLENKLTVIKMGGGFQTKSLRLEDASGRQYVLRSVNKDPSKALPEEFVGTFADNVIQDQISSSNPYAPMVVAELAGTVGIFHSTPRIVYVAASTSLGEFNETFGNTLCLFEERPTGNQENNPDFGNSRNIVNSEKLFEKIFSDPDHSVDEHAFLKARLFDMWIGDWDRHEDQWVWASFKQGKRTIYKPIPRDRDQAFSNLDGLIPQIAARKWAVRKTQNFDYTIRDINGLNQNGNYLDRLFTKKLTQQEWEVAASELQTLLTDDAIESAFLKMPRDIFEISGRETIEKLKQRRDDLLKYAREYYSFLSEEVTIVGTAEKERFEVTRSGDSTMVKVFAVEKKKNNKELIYQRAFSVAKTDEIKLYGMGGADEFILTGRSDRGILVRIIGGDGRDSVYDDSNVRGWRKMTKVYDNQSLVVSTASEVKAYETTDSLKVGFARKWYRFNVLAPKLAPGFNPDDGIYMGGGFTFRKNSFGKAPFGQVHSLWGNYAFKSGAYNFRYDGQFTEAVGMWDLIVVAKLNAPLFIYNYYGMGNETTLTNNDWLYHRVRLDQFIFEPRLQRTSGKHTFGVGLEYQTTRLEKSPDRFVGSAEAHLDSSDYQRKSFGGLQLSYQFTSVDNALYPRTGIRFRATALQMYQINGGSNYTQLSAQVAFYKTWNRLTIANRFGGSSILSDEFEFYQAATLGGMDNLRGYRRTRFAGKSSLYHNTEARFQLGKSKGYLLRGKYGLLAYFDTGRVWVPAESSATWHNGYGAGVWFLPYNKVAFTADYGISSDNRILNVSAGFLF